ncbi:MAG: iron-sulfur cluster repair di-iron protein [Thermoflexibacter sp.]|jgi:regulator of cell morphogenesis and NO signaling|nr:iron-sulfur cluster repair di-iron protein [Thermoflexibacter sp.]
MWSKSLAEIVSENYSFGAVLHQFGIDFFKYPYKTLESVCIARHISPTIVINELQAKLVTPSDAQQQINFDRIAKYPVDMVIDYLRQAHRVFMRRRLPYMLELVKNTNLPTESSYHDEIVNDLQIAFPIFAEDFIHHILEEESEIFNHIMRLDDVVYHNMPLSKIYYEMEKYSIQKFAVQHTTDDDDMRGIREITNDYEITKHTPFMLKVLYTELKSFEKELSEHAIIENKILIPKALKLESKVKKIFQEKAKLN